MTNDLISAGIDKAAAALLLQQCDDGHWCYELEADCTIPAEYILMMHHLDEVETDLQHKFANYIRSRQMVEGGWPLYLGGSIDISCSVKSYYALKLAGDDPDAPHMTKARDAILRRGGAGKSNVFTRIMLAMFQQVPWKAAPFMPVEIMLLPRWFFFHIDKIAYWSRTVMVPLLILCSLKVQAKNPSGTDVQELFVKPPTLEKNWFKTESLLARIYFYLDELARLLEWMIPGPVRTRAIRRAEKWIVERLNGEDGLGAIFPAMVNAYEVLHLLEYPSDHPDRQMAKKALNKLIVFQGDMAYCQPCVSPVWDTGLACHALLSADPVKYTRAIQESLEWLQSKQITDVQGDWAIQVPDVNPGGWAFQYNNDYYPDLDDTAVVAWAMHRSENPEQFAVAISRAENWILATQSRNGGYAAFDIDNTHYHLNEIPFADHGALLDPPTADVTARCLALIGRLKNDKSEENVNACLQYLKREQESGGAWFGRWGTNYIYGTWSVLTALAEAGIDPEEPFVQKSVQWLKNIQGPDGGWGEHNDSYQVDGPDSPRATTNQGSTSYQTAWALLALIASGEARTPSVERGIEYLLNTQAEDGVWHDPWHNAPGFPRVFYLKYHGYSKYFPLWTLAEYRNATFTNEALVA